MPEVMKTLFLNPPSYEGFDGGAGRALPGAARDQIVLVSHLAGSARGQWFPAAA